MDPAKRALRGCESADAFKFWHKQDEAHAKNYGADLDFVLIEKDPDGVVAGLDFKRECVYDANGRWVSGDQITMAEVIHYNDWLECGRPIYIVVSPDLKDWSVYEYLGGNRRPEPPIVQLRLVFEHGTEQDYWRWEEQIRAAWRASHRQWHEDTAVMQSLSSDVYRHFKVNLWNALKASGHKLSDFSDANDAMSYIASYFDYKERYE